MTDPQSTPYRPRFVVDGRTREARRVRALRTAFAAAAADLNLDVTDVVNLARLEVATALTAAIEATLLRQARGEPINLGELIAATNAQARVFAELGFLETV